MATQIARAIAIAYPDEIKKADGTPFVRPDWTGDDTIYSSGFYWSNADGDRFYSPTLTEAAEGLAEAIGMDENEAREVIAAGRATR
jgi:hypothetical protein